MTANSWIRGWDVESHSEPGKQYRVSLALGGHYGCSCPAWKFAKAPKADCKHIREITGNIEIINRVKGVEKLNMEQIAPGVKIVRASVRTQAFVITELTAEQLLEGNRKVRRRDEF